MNWITANKAAMDELFDSLLRAPLHSFDEELECKLPEKKGIYAISVGDGDEARFIWIGITPKSEKGLRRRVWEDHYSNATNTSDLPNVLKKLKPEWNNHDSKRWIKENCKVRWLEIEDKAIRELLEDYATAILQPNASLVLNPVRVR